MLMTSLLGIKSVYGYSVRAKDAIIGIIDEFYLDIKAWAVSSVAVRTALFPGRREIYLSSEVLEEIDPGKKAFFVQLTLEELRGELPNLKKMPSLKRARRLIGMSLHATDGMAGKVEDFIVNDADFAIRYLVVSPGALGDNLIISPWWVKKIDGKGGDIFLGANLDEVSQSPKYNFQVPVSREYENELRGFYENHPYWAGEAEKPKRRS